MAARGFTSVRGVPAGHWGAPQTVAGAAAAYQRAHPVTGSGDRIKAAGQFVPVATRTAGPVSALVGAAAIPATDPNLGYRYDTPSAVDCRNNTRAATNYGWRPNHYAYCQVYLYEWKYYNLLGIVLATGQDRVTLVAQGSFDRRVVTFTLYVDQVKTTSGSLPAGSTLTFGMTCSGDPAGSCQSASPPVTMPDQAWNNNNATYTFTSPDGVGYNGDGGHWKAFAFGSFHWTVYPACADCSANATTNGPTGALRFDGPGSPDMSPAHQTGATFQPVNSRDNQGVDTLAFSWNGSYGSRSYAKAARHYWAALNHPNSTYPLTGNKQIPDMFTRLADEKLADSGRNAVAIPLCETVWGDNYAKGYGRPLQCDEFPYASTYQGSPLANGNPDGRRISVCPIDGPDNESAGLALKAFYQQQRIFDGGGTGELAIDWYNVAVTGVPSPPPAPAHALPCPIPNPGVSGGGRAVVVGHAAHAGDDYPYETVGQFEHQDEGTDTWNEYYGQCDSFAAWKVYENLAGGAAQRPDIPVPAVGWRPSNASVSPVNQNTWYNADNWDVMARKAGWTVNTIPAPGAIAYWPNATADPQDGHPASANGMGEFGHVGYVTDVYPDGSATIESYNLRLNGEYSTIHLPYGQPATDTSFNHGPFTVPWPTYFIHVGAGMGSATPASPEPAPGTVSSGYAAQVKVIGPGSPATEYRLGTQTWYLDPGHGELGDEEWTHTNGAAADSTATYTPSGLAAGTCYEVDAFVPDNYSDNPVAAYTISDARGTYLAAVNENQYTNDWAELGIYETNGNGGLSVRLDDRGAAGLYVAADAMRFWRQTSCAGYGDVSPIIRPSALTGNWPTDSGRGFFGSMQYTTTSGSSTVSSSSASYTPHLPAEDCYEIFAYVPDNYSDNNAARYEVNDNWHGTFWPQVNENVFTNQFTDLGAFQSRSDGSLPVYLNNFGPPGQYVAADAVAYTLDARCNGVGESGTGLGNVYQPYQVGPGSSPAQFSTTSPWYTQLGHGYAQHELWTYDNGLAADSTAIWTFFGHANTCYSVSAYIPDNYADNPQAHYTVSTSRGGFGGTQDQENYTNEFMPLGALTTGSDGIVHVTLNDIGPVGDYTAADAMEFDLGGPGC
jgi:surface antigen